MDSSYRRSTRLRATNAIAYARSWGILQVRLLVALLLATGGLALLPAAFTAASPSLTVSPVTGAFYTDTNSNGLFNATSADVPAFTQTFPVINFNPPNSVVPCSPGPFTRPFTDVVYNGSTCINIQAVGNGYQAGVTVDGSHDLAQFQAVFTGTFTALGSGSITFNFYSDDGWILGIGQDANNHQPTYFSGPMANVPAGGATPIHGYSVVGSFNEPSSPVANNLTVNFPAAGTYPFEIDYTEVRGGQLALTVTGNGTLIPPAPTVTPPAAQSGDEGTAKNFDLGSFDDALYGLTTTGPWNVDVNWGDGTPDTVHTASAPGSLGSQAHTYADNGAYSVTVAVTNNTTGQSSSNSFPITVNNVAPAVGAISGPAAPVAINTLVNAGASFSDPGTLDTHTAVWNWGDGSTSSGAVTESNGPGSVGGSHTYGAAGVYTVQLTVTDKDGGVGSSTFQYVVVYDPSAGFVTGGGAINSPAGAYVANPTLTGPAHFGFVSKYQKGNNTPVGQTEFQFQLGNLNFHSSSYDSGSLVISGPLARYTGTGTINGAGNYKFVVVAYDCAVAGNCSAAPDGFRIQITDANNNVVYDNVMAGSGALTQANTQPIAQGDIVIHSR